MLTLASEEGESGKEIEARSAPEKPHPLNEARLESSRRETEAATAEVPKTLTFP